MRWSHSCLIYTSTYCDTAAIIQLIFHLIIMSLSQFLLSCPRSFQLFFQKSPVGGMDPSGSRDTRGLFHLPFQMHQIEPLKCQITLWHTLHPCSENLLGLRYFPPKRRGRAEGSVKRVHTGVVENLAHDGQNMTQHGRISSAGQDVQRHTQLVCYYKLTINSGLQLWLVGEEMAQATTAFTDPLLTGTRLSWLQG